MTTFQTIHNWIYLIISPQQKSSRGVQNSGIDFIKGRKVGLVDKVLGKIDLLEMCNSNSTLGNGNYLAKIADFTLTSDTMTPKSKLFNSIPTSNFLLLTSKWLQSDFWLWLLILWLYDSLTLWFLTADSKYSILLTQGSRLKTQGSRLKAQSSKLWLLILLAFRFFSPYENWRQTSFSNPAFISFRQWLTWFSDRFFWNSTQNEKNLLANRNCTCLIDTEWPLKTWLKVSQFCQLFWRISLNFKP